MVLLRDLKPGQIKDEQIKAIWSKRPDIIDTAREQLKADGIEPTEGEIDSVLEEVTIGDYRKPEKLEL